METKIKRKYEAISLGEFLRKIAIDYLRYGYTRYAFRTIPDGKNLYEIDAKIMKVYGCTFSRALRHHRRRKGLASVVYIRFKNRFILVASGGSNEAFDKIDSLDFHSTPLHVDGYTIGVKRNKPCVMIKPSSSPPRQFCWVIAEDDKLVHNKEIRVVSWRKSTLWI
jgi:hypothetical protein